MRVTAVDSHEPMASGLESNFGQELGKITEPELDSLAAISPVRRV
jgi:hypothetical protein